MSTNTRSIAKRNILLLITLAVIFNLGPLVLGFHYLFDYPLHLSMELALVIITLCYLEAGRLIHININKQKHYSWDEYIIKNNKNFQKHIIMGSIVLFSILLIIWSSFYAIPRYMDSNTFDLIYSISNRMSFWLLFGMSLVIFMYLIRNRYSSREDKFN